MRFSTSFLAQILGLKITPRYLEADVPEDYEAKVKVVLNTSMADLGLDMTFTEEEAVPVRVGIMRCRVYYLNR